jgi:hypothetical protein
LVSSLHATSELDHLRFADVALGLMVDRMRGQPIVDAPFAKADEHAGERRKHHDRYQQ